MTCSLIAQQNPGVAPPNGRLGEQDNFEFQEGSKKCRRSSRHLMSNDLFTLFVFISTTVKAPMMTFFGWYQNTNGSAQQAVARLQKEELRSMCNHATSEVVSEHVPAVAPAISELLGAAAANDIWFELWNYTPSQLQQEQTHLLMASTTSVVSDNWQKRPSVLRGVLDKEPEVQCPMRKHIAILWLRPHKLLLGLWRSFGVQWWATPKQ